MTLAPEQYVISSQDNEPVSLDPDSEQIEMFTSRLELGRAATNGHAEYDQENEYLDNEAESDELEPAVTSRTRVSRVLRWVSAKIENSAARSDLRAERRNEEGTILRRTGQAAVSAFSRSYPAQKAKTTFDYVRVNPDDPESVTRDGWAVKKLAEYRSDEAKARRAERRQNPRAYALEKIERKASRRADKHNAKLLKDIQKGKDAQEAFERHAQRAHKNDDWAERKKLKVERKGRHYAHTRRHIGRHAWSVWELLAEEQGQEYAKGRHRKTSSNHR